jgi:hypothetical protein
MDKKALLYIDDAKVISDTLKEQRERSKSKVLIELSVRWANVIVYVAKLHEERREREFRLRDAEIDKLKFEASNEKLRKENVDLHEQLEILTKDIHALEQRI